MPRRKKPNIPVYPGMRLPLGLSKALNTNKTTADSEALLSDLIDVWGGTRQLAIDVHGEFAKAPPGGMTRQRILEMLQRLIVTNTTHDIGQTLKPPDMTDAELEEVALHYVAKVTGKVTSKDTDHADSTAEW